MYRLDYQYTHDIDWFCRINDIPVHLASNGGTLPRSSYTIKNLVKLQHMVANMRQNFRCAVNNDYLLGYLRQGEYYADFENISEVEMRSLLPNSFEITNDVAELPRTLLLYGWSFIEMAKRGFCSFDRREEDGLYQLVAWPVEYNEQAIDQEIYDLLVEYEACCFPPYHNDYSTNIPDIIRFDIDSIQLYYHR